MSKPSTLQLVFIKLLQAFSPYIKSDKVYLKWYYFLYTGKRLDFNNPKTFSEKIQWLKIHNTSPEYTIMADKYAMKRFVAGKIGEGHTFPLLGVWDRFDDIDFDSMPDKFVLKTNHDSGGVWIIQDKATADLAKIKKDADHRLSKNYFYPGREHPYKHIPRRIIAEPYMEDMAGCDLKDYKVFCFSGVPMFIQVDSDRFSAHKRDFYDTNWNLMDFGVLFPRSYKAIKRPDHFDEMLEIARKLSSKIPFLRVDLFNIKGKIYVGELTFHPGGGVEKIEPKEWENKLGDLIKIDRDGE